jgi:Collagen triple helix repeat (20 copies)
MRRRITPSLVLSLLALFVALSGTAFAAKYVITSTKQIKPSVRKALKGNRGPTGPRGLQGLQGPQGPAGAQGAQGPAGPAATVGVVTVTSPHEFLPPGGFTTDLRAICPPGMVVVGTGFNTGIGNADFVLSYGTFVGGFMDNDVSITIETYVQAICASGVGNGGGASRSASNASDSAMQRFEADQAKARARHR